MERGYNPETSLGSKRTARAYNKVVEVLAAHSSSSHCATTWSRNAWLLFLTHTNLVWHTLPSKSVRVTSAVIVASSSACRQRSAINCLLLALSLSLAALLRYCHCLQSQMSLEHVITTAISSTDAIFQLCLTSFVLVHGMNKIPHVSAKLAKQGLF